MNTGHPCVFFDQHPEHHPAHGATARGHKQVLGLLPAQDGRPALGQVGVDAFTRHLTKGHQPLLVALAHDAQHAFVHAQVVSLQTDQLAHAQTTGVQELEHGAVAQAQGGFIGRTQKIVNLGLRHGFGHAQGLAR